MSRARVVCTPSQFPNRGQRVLRGQMILALLLNDSSTQAMLSTLATARIESASAFGIFLLRQAFQSVPKELEEAARMDGCWEIGIWWSIMLPAIRPSLVTLAIFVFIGAWSDFYGR